MDSKIRTFLDIEKKYHLFDKEIWNIKYWVYAREEVWGGFLKSYQKSKETEKEKSSVHGRKSLGISICTLRKVIASFLSHCKLKEVDILILNHPRKVLNDNKYICLYTEYIARNYTSKLILERPFHGMHFYPTETKNLIYTDISKITGVVRFFLQKKFYKRNMQLMYAVLGSQLKDALQEMTKIFSKECDEKELIYGIIWRIFQIQSIDTYMRYVIRRVHPKVIIEVVGMADECRVINSIAKEEGIPTIELQHGNVCNNLSYSFGESCPQLPDYFYTYSVFWNTFVQMPSTDIIVGGYPYLEDQVNKYAQCRKQYLFDMDRKIRVLILSQGKEINDIVKIGYEAYLLLDRNKYQFVFRLHPGESENWKEEYPYLLNEDIEITFSKKISLYESLATCDIQVGVDSTALFEGLIFNIYTLIYCREEKEQMKKLVDKGYAIGFVSSEDLAYWITNYSFANRQERSDSNFFWEKDALRKMCTQINSLLN